MAYVANGSDPLGDKIDQQCDDCVHGIADDVGCPIAFVQMNYNYKQEGAVKEILDHFIPQTGECTMYKLISKYIPNNLKQGKLF